MNIGGITIDTRDKNVSGTIEKIQNQSFYKIENVDQMRPFFMSVVSDSNHWMFIGSNGGVTCGRKDSDRAIFPYYTDDKIIESIEVSGPKTLIQIFEDDHNYLWEPFSERYQGVYRINRTLYKSSFGNQITFEEINHDLNLKFKYTWFNSDKFGFVRKAEIENLADNSRQLKVLDGVQNILPTFIKETVQNSKSNLVDAYKRHELLKKDGLALFTLNAVIVDRAEPSESLKATVAYNIGTPKEAKVHISSKIVEAFRRGVSNDEILELRAEKGAYLMEFSLNIQANKSSSWMLVLDDSKSSSDIVEIQKLLENKKELSEAIQIDIAKGTERLMALAGQSDGLQLTGDELENSRHFANVMFNIMRGGIFDCDYWIEKRDFGNYLKRSNKILGAEFHEEIRGFNDRLQRRDLIHWAEGKANSDLLRLTKEYLPLKFSRRHGDPSRPWNKFSINTVDELTGEKILDYQGNWRDIYQNWEALAYSYPEFIDGMIYKFLNTSTFDGYNPYRVTKGGFDWEIVEPEDPWAFIGYWGDHQIIYLLKFLEFSEAFYPGRLVDIFQEKSFVYANVPYRIKPYQDILKNPKDTIIFETALDKKIREDRDEIGADGALLSLGSGQAVKANFIEKILVTLLAKASNYIPEGGIWLNTQRPEWNDANNALVGNGVSMVTLYYLRRFVSFFENLLEGNSEEVMISSELKVYFDKLKLAFKEFQPKSFDSGSRKKMMDVLGSAASQYRDGIYDHGFSENQETLNLEQMKEFCFSLKEHFDHAIEFNRRSDGLYHAYNLVSYTESEAQIDYLSPMLEGQVAVLTSTKLTDQESLDLIEALESSDLYREDQSSFMLYPNKEVSSFLDKNVISDDQIQRSSLIQELLVKKDGSIVQIDLNGQVHFNANFNNANSLKEALHEQSLIDDGVIFEVFEEVFNHRAFTGRSGTFFGYEGLGSIYWHMVSKLVLAAEEVAAKCTDSSLQNKLIDAFEKTKYGIGVHKHPEVYGAIPTDPYSHTPANKGAQQPGMTGQVKEDVISRFIELGIRVVDGKLTFDTSLIQDDEFLKSEKEFSFYDLNQQWKTMKVNKGALAYTYCQIPVLINSKTGTQIELKFTNGTSEIINGLTLSQVQTAGIFGRLGNIESIQIS